MKKKNFLLASFALVIVVILALGASYAIFRINVTNNKNFKVVTGKLELTIENADNNTIEINYMQPVKESDAMSSSGYTFTLRNTGNIDSDYTIYLDDLIDNNKTRLSDSVVDVNLYNNTTNTGTTYNLADIQDRVIGTGTIEANETISFTLRVWLDYSAGNDAQNKYYGGKLRITGTQDNQR